MLTHCLCVQRPRPGGGREGQGARQQEAQLWEPCRVCWAPESTPQGRCPFRGFCATIHSPHPTSPTCSVGSTAQRGQADTVV